MNESQAAQRSTLTPRTPTKTSEENNSEIKSIEPEKPLTRLQKSLIEIRKRTERTKQERVHREIIFEKELEEQRTRTRNVTHQSLEKLETLNPEINTTPPEANTPNPNETQSSPDEIPTHPQQIDNPTPNNRLKPTSPTQPIRTRNKMENNDINNNATALQLQQLIALAINEFNGDDKNTRFDNLTRFLQTTEALYDSLTTNKEREIFGILIKSKLSNNTFKKISSRNITTYPKLKEILTELYTEPETLKELEMKFSKIRQKYGETIRDYGNRLTETLDRYKQGYRQKYDLDSIEPSYEKHLDSEAITIFKKGINNSILKDKIRTSKLTDLDDTISKAERIEKTLNETESDAEDNSMKTDETELGTIPKPVTKTNLLPETTCNYCQQTGHILANCEIRINNERILQNHINLQPQNTRQLTQNYNPGQNTFNTNYNRPTKHCSFCKTTTGHTYDECRRKFQNNPQPQYNPNRYNPNNNSYRNPQINYTPRNQNYNNFTPNNSFNRRFIQPNYQQPNRSHNNQFQHPNNAYNRPAITYEPQTQQSNNNYQNNNSQRNNNYPPRFNNQPQNSNFTHNNYSQNNSTYKNPFPRNTIPQQKIPEIEYHSTLNQPPTNKNFNPNSSNIPPQETQLANMMENLSINYLNTEQSEFYQYNDQGNADGSSQD